MGMREVTRVLFSALDPDSKAVDAGGGSKMETFPPPLSPAWRLMSGV